MVRDVRAGQGGGGGGGKLCQACAAFGSGRRRWCRRWEEVTGVVRDVRAGQGGGGGGGKEEEGEYHYS